MGVGIGTLVFMLALALALPIGAAHGAEAHRTGPCGESADTTGSGPARSERDRTLLATEDARSRGSSYADQVRIELLADAAVALDIHSSLDREAPDSLGREIARLSAEIATSVRRMELLAMQLDCLEEMRLGWIRVLTAEIRPRPRPMRRALAYGVVLGGGVGANGAFRLDTDAGGYRDTFWSQDKLFHFAAGYLLASEATVVRVPPRWSVLLTCAAAAGFELTQRYASSRDAIASCGGAALGAIAWRRSQR